MSGQVFDETDVHSLEKLSKHEFWLSRQVFEETTFALSRKAVWTLLLVVRTGCSISSDYILTEYAKIIN
jgi:predicted nucleic acid-binding protein